MVVKQLFYSERTICVHYEWLMKTTSKLLSQIWAIKMSPWEQFLTAFKIIVQHKWLPGRGNFYGGLAGLYGTKETKANGTNAQQENGWSLNHSAWRAPQTSELRGKWLGWFQSHSWSICPSSAHWGLWVIWIPPATQFEHCSSIKSLQGKWKMLQKNVTSVQPMLRTAATRQGDMKLYCRSWNKRNSPTFLAKQKSNHVK